MSETEAQSVDRACPRCAETIKRAAVVCRFCGAEFHANGVPKQPRPMPAKDAKPPLRLGWVGGCLGGVAVLALVIGGVAALGARPSDVEVVYATPVPGGEHCLDASIGGLHADLWLSVKRSLGNPDSMRDMRMQITSANLEGIHRVVFEFRAENQYGALQRQRVMGEVRNADCSIVTWRYF